MKDDKKKSVSMIIAKMKSDKPSYGDMKSENENMSESPTNENGDEMDNSTAHEAAAEEVMSALESKDKKAFVSSLKSLVQMCMDEYESSEKEEPSEPEPEKE